MNRKLKLTKGQILVLFIGRLIKSLENQQRVYLGALEKRYENEIGITRSTDGSMVLLNGTEFTLGDIQRIKRKQSDRIRALLFIKAYILNKNIHKFDDIYHNLDNPTKHLHDYIFKTIVLEMHALGMISTASTNTLLFSQDQLYQFMRFIKVTKFENFNNFKGSLL